MENQKQSLRFSRYCIDWVTGDIPLYKLDRILKRLTSVQSQIHVRERRFITEPLLELDEHARLIKGTPMCVYDTKSNCMCSLYV